MALVDNFRKGSFRGVEFDAFTFERTQVKKTTEHQYANSERRYIEERGVQKADYTVTMSIFGDDNLITRRNKLRKALESEGEGVLVLPFEGEFQAKCTEYSDSQDINDGLGRCDFSATFKVVSENELAGNPIVIKVGKISLNNRVEQLRSKLAKMVNDSVLITNAMSYTKALEKISGFGQIVLSFSKKIGSGSLSSLVSNFITSIPSFLGGNISLLGSAISTLFFTFESVFDVASDLLTSSISMFNYGDTDIKVSPNTPHRAEQVLNSQVLNTQIQISALGSACNAFANTEFSNETELNIAKEKIESQIEKVLNSEAMKNTKISGIEDIKYLLKQLQVDFSDVVAEKEANTPKLQNIKANGESIAMLSYKYYDNIDAVKGIIELNNIDNPKSVTGDIRIYENVGK